MFGWEFPPHISGGLGTACFGLTQSLSRLKTRILFVVPKAEGHRPFGGVEIMGAGSVQSPNQRIDYGKGYGQRSVSSVRKRGGVSSNIVPIKVNVNLRPYFTDEFLFGETRLQRWDYQVKESRNNPRNGKGEKEESPFSFTGGYGPHLMEEVEQYAQVAAIIARDNSFDVIHAHDWLTYPAGIEAKRMSGKPLVVHVHATEFDRAGEDINFQVSDIERTGMEKADRIIAVSQWTKNIIVSRYGIPENKVTVVHNGVAAKPDKVCAAMPLIGGPVITFLGRITHQKGPAYFLEAACKVLQKFPDVHFVMAGSGDLLPNMMELAATLKISSRVHFTGFLKSAKVDQVWAISNVYVMPSVSEPFGIAPLEAMMSGVPVIISKQSGVSEVVRHAIKVDFWDTEALASAICDLLTYESLNNTIKRESLEESKKITWDRAATKINIIYDELTTKT